MINTGLFTSTTDQWATPQSFFDILNAEFNFTLDPCADANNAKCTKFYTKEDDGLSKSWDGEKVFCNPPYGKEISKFVKKCAEVVAGGGATSLLCSYLQGQTLVGFTNIFTEKQR